MTTLSRLRAANGDSRHPHGTFAWAEEARVYPHNPPWAPASVTLGSRILAPSCSDTLDALADCHFLSLRAFLALREGRIPPELTDKRPPNRMYVCDDGHRFQHRRDRHMRWQSKIAELPASPVPDVERSERERAREMEGLLDFAAGARGDRRSKPHAVSRRFLSVALLVVGLAPVVARADQLDEIRARKQITVGVFDSNPPFGFIDGASRALAGYDIDFAQELARRLGVRLELKATNPANRIPLIASNKVNVVIAAFTYTEERAKQVDFTHFYFLTGQQFLAPRGKFSKKEDLAIAKIGAVKGTTGEQQARAAFPKANVVSFDESALAFVALRNGIVQAITQDGAVLAGLLAASPDRDRFEISSYRISDEPYAIAVKKGEARLLAELNRLLLELEKDGTAAQLHEKWFGKASKTPLARDFKIVAR